MRTWKKLSIGAATTIGLSVVAFVSCAPQLGAGASGKRLAIMQTSPQYRDGRFQNSVQTSVGLSFGDSMRSMWDFVVGGDQRVPIQTLTTLRLDKNDFSQREAKDLRLAWLGHSAVLVGIGTLTVLTDPALSKRASPLPFVGPKQFEYSNPIRIEDLPAIDVVLISHDHYDHLDHASILALKDKVRFFVMPLGVGAHLEKWGVAANKIIELDWWQNHNIDNVSFTATPSRHFSGRSGIGGNNTLWASWAIKGPEHNVFFGGDSGYFDGFKQIGERLGPFDVTMLECGAYNEAWPQIHMMPEQSAQAHVDLRGNKLMPIHWGKFNLSLHAWDEPIERLLKHADKLGINVVTPMVGASMTLGEQVPLTTPWWRQHIAADTNPVPHRQAKQNTAEHS